VRQLVGLQSGAAIQADRYSTATISDWFLPSLGEVKLMYDNLLEAGVSSFGNTNYWSSSESSANNAWSQFFNTGGQSNVGKHTTLPVRAVRAF
jgi:hypothetical protein